jgi:sulfate transport system ATP-binding protein
MPRPTSEEGMIDRIVHLGFEVRLEMTLADDSPLIAQLTRAQVEELELQDGQIVYVTAARSRTFDENGASPRTEELVLA